MSHELNVQLNVRAKPPPVDMNQEQSDTCHGINQDICLGKITGDMGGERWLWLEADARLQHLHIIGRTGTGKTTLIHNLLAQDFYSGHGAALLDPHGDLAVAVLNAVPRSRTRETIYFNPSDLARPIGFNPLSNIPLGGKLKTRDQ